MDKNIEKVLARIERDREENGNLFWTISHETGEFLNNLIRENKFTRVLEVGTSIGYSGIWLAEALREIDGKLYTVESHNERFDIASANFKEAGVSEVVTQLKGHAPDVELPCEIDLLFLDATKMEYVSYIQTYMDLMHTGGYIVADNAISHADDLGDYRAFVFGSPRLESHLEEIGTGLFVSKIVE
jgi:predicted O-methyltransferase YrrM